MFLIEVEHDLEKITSWAKRIESQLAKPDLRGEPANRVISHFRGLISKGSFVPVTEATLQIRARRGQSGKVLNVTGSLNRSIRVLNSKAGQVTIGSSLGKAGLLRFGGFTSERSAIGGKRVPSRDYLFVTESVLSQAFVRPIFDSLTR